MHHNFWQGPRKTVLIKPHLTDKESEAQKLALTGVKQPVSNVTPDSDSGLTLKPIFFQLHHAAY